MANGTKNVETKVVVKSILLDLSAKEAVALQSLLGKVCGITSGSGLRGTLEDISRALEDAGVKYPYYKNLGFNEVGNIYIERFDEKDLQAAIDEVAEVPTAQTINSPELENLIRLPGHKIAAIKLYREMAQKVGVPYGLKEAKEEIERRARALGYSV